jgi:hypothetical protein
MSKKVDAMVKKILENVSRINDEEILASILVYTSLAAKNPHETKAKAAAMTAPKPKTLIPAPQAIATEARILEYKFKDKDMVAIQTNGKPDEALLDTLRAFRARRMMSYYSHVPSNPFGNSNPFWAGPACDEVKNTLMAVA